MTEQGQSTRVSRRTIAKGAAWAVPVVPLAVATPAYAQSGCQPTFQFANGSCRCPGSGQNDKDYFVKVCNVGVTCPGLEGSVYVEIRANTGQHPVYKAAFLVGANPSCSTVQSFTAPNSSSVLRLYYGATAAAASAADAPFVDIAAPVNDCDTTQGALGQCAHS